ncbi:amino acid adenylation domain-containing protein [Marinivivus vitaminiproducens]|uniref:amino acid adenylation domain-containing protein n=1 Tax=Marinivivus vitaminiproducens TaxID=3035935 RepID=UPI0027A6C5A8|nr:amino acid adenylation domain-containing protein [Geminicoccaceae bacterium SCSIO 64248]
MTRATVQAQEPARGRAAIENIYPLTPMQEGLLFQALLTPESGQYVPQAVLHLAGTIEPDALLAAWRQALARHPVLRSGFHWEQRDQPFQVVHRDARLSWTRLDWSDAAPDERHERLARLMDANRAEPFDLRRPPLLRLHWIDAGGERRILLLCYHHIILDGWSVGRLVREVFQIYLRATGTAVPVPPPPRPYADYVAWLAKRDTGPSVAFWKTYLAGCAGPTPFLPAGPATDFAALDWTCPQPLAKALQAVCRQAGVTLNTVLQAALGLLIGRHTGSRDVLFGVVTSGRPATLDGALDMVGLFMNTLPIRVTIDPAASVAELLAALQARQAAVSEHEHIPLAMIQDGRGPLFDCLLAFENYPISTDFAERLPFRLVATDFEERTHFPLTLLASAPRDSLAIKALYARSVIDEVALGLRLARLERLLEQIALEPDAPLHRLSILSEDDRHRLAAWNATDSVLEGGDTLVDLLDAEAERSADRLALVVGEERLTYRDLHERAGRLAHHLIERGIGPEHRVAIHLERSVELVVALLAVLKAGAAYLPLEPDYPRARREATLADGAVHAMITDTSRDLPPLQAPAGLDVIDMSATASLRTPSEAMPMSRLRPDNPAYVIHTSGSTGSPKGVVNTHRGIVNRLLWMQRTYGLEERDRVLHKTPLGFDVSVWELFWPLMTGATLVLAAPGGHRDSRYLAQTIRAQGITTLHFVPPMLAAFLDEPEAGFCSSLTRVLCSGEALSPGLRDAFFRTFPAGPALHNLYGPTEAAIDVTAWACAPDESGVPIGRPIANTRIHILDSDLEPVPPGVAGELHIGGVNLARGYLGRPGLTAERFVPNPFNQARRRPGEAGFDQDSMLYRTGDLARWRPDGAIEYLGRTDHQVKRRGVRIELQEIEAVLERHPDVRQAVVVCWDDEAGDLLSAYVVVAPGSDAARLEAALRAYAADHVPDVMTPDVVRSLESLPLTPNGKPDRAALPRPGRAPSVHVAPETPTEQALARIWAEVLRIPSPSADAHFFEQGGHSLLATRVISRIRRELEVEVRLQTVFERPVLTDLATYVDALRVGTSAPAEHKVLDI